jgi:hypothetical protein
MSETDILQAIRLHIGNRADTRIFRNNTGTGWTGSSVVRNRDGSLTIRDPRPLHAGLCVGSSDLIGWQSVVVTPDMVGTSVAVFVAIEVKTERTKPTRDQVRFIDCVSGHGGFAGIARSPDDALDILRTQ